MSLRFSILIQLSLVRIEIKRVESRTSELQSLITNIKRNIFKEIRKRYIKELDSLLTFFVIALIILFKIFN